VIDFTSSCQRTADVLANISDDQLSDATPCQDMRLSDLVTHIGDLARAFADAARKEFGPFTDDAPDPDGARLDADWRTSYPAHLADLARAWQDPSAWQGMTRAGGFDMPGDVNALVALTEVVIHGWDVARATGQPYDVDAESAAAVLPHVTETAAEGPVEGMFGPAVPVADDAPVLDRIIALSGRDPAWRAP
jgi:uncharacterized protein (TIGR03086 family)